VKIQQGIALKTYGCVTKSTKNLDILIKVFHKKIDMLLFGYV